MQIIRKTIGRWESCIRVRWKSAGQVRIVRKENDRNRMYDDVDLHTEEIRDELN